MLTTPALFTQKNPSLAEPFSPLHSPTHFGYRLPMDPRQLRVKPNQRESHFRYRRWRLNQLEAKLVGGKLVDFILGYNLKQSFQFDLIDVMAHKKALWIWQ